MQYSELQLDALRELANIGSGTAGTALSVLLGRPVDIDVPRAVAIPVAEAVGAIGEADDLVSVVVLPIHGDMDAVVLLLFRDETTKAICRLLGVPPAGEEARSALAEIGNILGTSYLNALARLASLTLEPSPPRFAEGRLEATMAPVLADRRAGADTVLLLDSEMEIAGEACSLSFMLLPSAAGVTLVLDRLGVGA